MLTHIRQARAAGLTLVRSTALDPVSPQIGHDIGPAAYAGGQLASGAAPPEHAYAGLSVPVAVFL